MQKKVCHLTSVHSIDDGRIFRKECTSLAANGFDVTLIACGNESFEDVKNGVKRISLRVPVKNRLQRFFKRSNAVYKKALEVDADIYHFHDPELLPVGLKLKKKGKKVIFDSHEFYGLQIKERNYIPKILRIIIAFFYNYYETYVCKKIDAVIQICTLNGSNYFANRSRINVFINNVSPIPNKININNLSFNKRKQIAYVGALSYNRGIFHLIKAANLANANLLLIGNFSSEIFKNEISIFTSQKNIELKGFMDSDKVQSILNNCYAGVSTLLHVNQYHQIDTFPSKVFDYMAAGIPVILSNTPYAKKMIKKYNFGICVEPNNINQIAKTIDYLYRNPQIAKKMGQNGRKAIINEFNWNIEEKKMIELYLLLFNTHNTNNNSIYAK